MRILAIDPGTDKSAYVITDGKTPVEHGILDNEAMLMLVQRKAYEWLAIEMIASYGMPVGKEVFETCVWIGRFIDRWTQEWGGPYLQVLRKDVKMHLCGSVKGVNDAVVRQALIDLYPRTGGGATPQIGIKDKPGPLFGLSKDVWSALAVAVTAHHQIQTEVMAA